MQLRTACREPPELGFRIPEHDSASGTELLGPDSVSFTHELLKLGIDIIGRREAKVVAVPHSSKVFHSIQQRVCDAPTEPEPGIKMPDTDYCAGESHSCHNDDTGLLRIDSHRAACARCTNPAVERTLPLGRLAVKVRRKTHAHARMPQVLRDEAMAATRALPEWWFGQSRSPIWSDFN
jgi:hypothetical protein